MEHIIHDSETSSSKNTPRPCENQNPRLYGYLTYGALLGIACSIECTREIREKFGKLRESIYRNALDNPSWYLFKYEVESYLPFLPVFLRY